MNNRGFTFTASLASDIVAYRLSLFAEGNDEAVLTKDYPDDDAIKVESDSTLRRIDFGTDTAFDELDGTYRAEVRAVDDADQVSPPLEGELSIDEVVPDAPTNFVPF